MLRKLTVIIAINGFVKIVYFCNRFDKALTEIFQFCMALASKILVNFFLVCPILPPVFFFFSNIVLNEPGLGT